MDLVKQESSCSVDYSLLSKEELIMLVQERDKEKELLLKDLQDKAQIITSLSEKVASLNTDISNTQSELRVLKMKTHHYLSYISGTSKEFNISNDIDSYVVKLENDLQQSKKTLVQSSSEMNLLMTKLHAYEDTLDKRNASVRNLRKLVKNQSEVMGNLNSLIQRLINSMNSSELTEEQESIIYEFRVSYCSDDDENSDVENILECDEDLNSPSKLLSPMRVSFHNSPTSNSSSQQDGFTFLSFLHFISTSFSSLPFQPDPLCPYGKEEVLTSLRSELSLLMDRLCSILEKGPVIQQFIPDHVFEKCPDCGSPFSTLVRRHHCRWCGRVVCAKCSCHRISSSFIGKNKRICDKCNMLYIYLGSSFCN